MEFGEKANPILNKTPFLQNGLILIWVNKLQQQRLANAVSKKSKDQPLDFLMNIHLASINLDCAKWKV
jgi:hypothetical protein